jgi:hypothetical protein
MSASPLAFLRATPPAPKVVVLPDALFFTRSVPVPAAAGAAEVATLVELALEAASPFPVAQLYYGWRRAEGTDQALVFAAYRRRFTAEQIAEWDGADLVLPGLAVLAGAAVEPGTTVIVTSTEGYTGLHWTVAGAPTRVISLPVASDATEADRAAVREDLIRRMGGTKTLLDVGVPVAVSAGSDGAKVFRAGDLEVNFNEAAAGALDVRDKLELEQLRQARRRDLTLWRVALGGVVALGLLALGEITLVAGAAWERSRQGIVKAQRPTVEKIEASDSLARRIEELATKRLRPFEMVAILVGDDGKRKPAEIWFTRVVTTPGSIYSLAIEASSSDAAQVSGYTATLRSLPAVERAEVTNLKTAGNTATFILEVSFKPDALTPPHP